MKKKDYVINVMKNAKIVLLGRQQAVFHAPLEKVLIFLVQDVFQKVVVLSVVMEVMVI